MIWCDGLTIDYTTIRELSSYITIEEHRILHPCLCGSQDVEPVHTITADGFAIWIECKTCGATCEHSHQSYLNAAAEWNKTHEK